MPVNANRSGTKKSLFVCIKIKKTSFTQIRTGERQKNKKKTKQYTETLEV